MANINPIKHDSLKYPGGYDQYCLHSSLCAVISRCNELTDTVNKLVAENNRLSNSTSITTPDAGDTPAQCKDSCDIADEIISGFLDRVIEELRRFDSFTKMSKYDFIVILEKVAESMKGA